VEISAASAVTQVLRHRAVTDPDRVVLRFVDEGPDRTLTRRELDRAATATASWLRERFATGDRVLLTYSFGLDFVVGLVGCLYAGMIAVPVPLPGRDHERRRLQGVAGDCGAVALLTDSPNRDGLDSWVRANGLDLAVLATDILPPEAGATSAAEPPEHGRDSVAVLQYTSGSTGDPKGVLITHGNILHNVESMRRTFDVDETTRLGGWIPHYHDMGLMGQILPALMICDSGTFMTPTAFLRRPHHWLRLIHDHRIEVSAAPNFAYELCRRRVTPEQVANIDLSHWRYAINGSEPIRPETLDGFASHFAEAGFRAEAMTPSYGLAEATLFVATTGRRGPTVLEVDPGGLEHDELRPAEATGHRRGLVSCGTPQDLDVRIVDPVTSQPVADGRVGEVQVRGGSVSAGYWGAEPRQGYLCTGDLGALHDGELYITGRRKEMLIHNGRNLYPQDVEHELRSAHPELDGSVGAAVVLDDDTLVVLHEVKGAYPEHALRALAAGMKQTALRVFGIALAGVVLLRPGGVRRTTSGKIQRSAMRELLRANALRPLYVHAGPAASIGAAA
jgi:acyl-CoA synthetase (AMP-forming)/AMP-acid ligase II